MQDALPYTEPPYWYYPIRQSLAAALLQAGRYADAEKQFQRALSRAPANGWSYYGLAELHKARGNIAAARKAGATLAKMPGSATEVAADFQSLKLRECKVAGPVTRILVVTGASGFVDAPSSPSSPTPGIPCGGDAAARGHIPLGRGNRVVDRI